MSRANKQQQILEASSHIFLERGFEKATVEAIAVEAKVGKGTIYEYFDSKEILFIEMIKAGVTYVYNDLYHVFKQKETMEETVEDFLHSSHQLFHEHGDKMRILYEDITKMPHELEVWIVEKSEWLVSQIAKTLQSFMDDGQIRDVCPNILAMLILHSLQIGFYYKVVRGERDLESILRTQMDIIFKGVNPIP